MKFILIAAFALLSFVQSSLGATTLWLSYQSRVHTEVSLGGSTFEQWIYSKPNPHDTPSYTHRLRITDANGNVTSDTTDYNSFSVSYGRNYDWTYVILGVTVSEQATTYWTLDNPTNFAINPRCYLTANHVSSSGQGGSIFYFDKTVAVGAQGRATTQFGYAENGNYTSGYLSLTH